MAFKAEFKGQEGLRLPPGPQEQLMAPSWRFRSWDKPRAILLPPDMNDSPPPGSAVNVQMMVSSNMVTPPVPALPSPQPRPGEKKLFGEFLMNPGRDVVAGVRTPQTIDQTEGDHAHCYDQVRSRSATPGETHRDMQDMEFTIEDKKLYMLPDP